MLMVQIKLLCMLLLNVPAFSFAFTTASLVLLLGHLSIIISNHYTQTVFTRDLSSYLQAKHLRENRNIHN